MLKYSLKQNMYIEMDLLAVLLIKCIDYTIRPSSNTGQ